MRSIHCEESDEHLIAAREALSQGDSVTAMSELDLAIADRPDPWAYAERAKLHATIARLELFKSFVA